MQKTRAVSSFVLSTTVVADNSCCRQQLLPTTGGDSSGLDVAPDHSHAGMERTESTGTEYQCLNE